MIFYTSIRQRGGTCLYEDYIDFLDFVIKTKQEYESGVLFGRPILRDLPGFQRQLEDLIDKIMSIDPPLDFRPKIPVIESTISLPTGLQYRLYWNFIMLKKMLHDRQVLNFLISSHKIKAFHPCHLYYPSLEADKNQPIQSTFTEEITLLSIPFMEPSYHLLSGQSRLVDMKDDEELAVSAIPCRLHIDALYSGLDKLLYCSHCFLFHRIRWMTDGTFTTLRFSDFCSHRCLF